MMHHVEFSEEEWALVLELLEQEHHDLPVEIRHTRTASVREDLHRRQELITLLLDRLRAVPVA